MTELRNRIRMALLASALLAVPAVLGACESGAYPFDIFPEMHYQQSYRVQEPSVPSMPEGSVPTTGREVPLDLGEAIATQNPVPATPESVQAGQVLFASYCSPCHGPGADGNSPVATKFADAGVRAPPSLLAGAAVVSPDGFIYGIVTTGLGNMPSLRKLITPEERWAIVNYLRSIQPR